MVKYILRMCNDKSTTWANYLKLICLKYGLPSPLQLIESQLPWSKQSWKDFIVARITAWHEREQRLLAANNSKMSYLNVELIGLMGRPHILLSHINCTQDVSKVRSHLKFLTKDLFPHISMIAPGPCLLCHVEYVDLYQHLLVSCMDSDLHDLRARLYPELVNAVVLILPTCAILSCQPPPKILAQFILDCTSPNLPNHFRLSPELPNIQNIFRVSRDWCHSTIKELKRRGFTSNQRQIMIAKTTLA